MEIDNDEIFYIREYSSIVGNVPKAIYVDKEYLYFISDKAKEDLKFLKALNKAFGKNIIILQYDKQIDQFIKNFFNNVVIVKYDIFDAGGNKVLILFIDPKSLKFAVGNNGNKLKAANKIFKELFNINQVLIKKDVVMEGG